MTKIQLVQKFKKNKSKNLKSVRCLINRKELVGSSFLLNQLKPSQAPYLFKPTIDKMGYKNNHQPESKLESNFKATTTKNILTVSVIHQSKMNFETTIKEPKENTYKSSKSTSNHKHQ